MLTLINQLFYKGKEHGIIIVENEESYTSKCDALILEDFETCEYNCKSGNGNNKRAKRGLYKSSAGYLINADINGAINIMRKHVYKTNQFSNELNTYILNNAKNFLNPVKFIIGNKKNILSKLTLGGNWGTSRLTTRDASNKEI